MNSFIFNYIKWILNFPYKNKIEYAFLLYRNKKKFTFLARLLGAKAIITPNTKNPHKNLLETVKTNDTYSNMACITANMLSIISGKLTNYEDIHINIPKEVQEKVNKKLDFNKKYIGIHPQAFEQWKNIKLDVFKNLVKEIINKGYTPIITGMSAEGTSYIDTLTNDAAINQSDYINLFDKVSLLELGAYYKKCKTVISVDTSAAHMSMAVNTPTLMIFYKDISKYWGPLNRKKNKVLISPKIENILDELNKRINPM